jgi:SagB-type dehydrogenase family enzyme
VVPLPRRQRSGEFVEVLLARRTWRGFGRKPLRLDALADLLQLTWGVQRWGQAGVRDRVPFKTAPTSGGRAPLEAYVLALRVDGLARGLYHYVADAHALELVRRGASARQVETYLGGQWFFRPASALVLMTAVVPRVRWRYPHAESYASVLLEAGHFCQTFCLVATWLRLAPFCTVALANSRIERDLRIDGVGEMLLYAAGVGTRPADGKWVQWPRHLPGHPYLPPRRRRGVKSA